MGSNPEALCGEAPQGQPMIRSESLEAVCVEAPEGHPMIHRRHPRHPRNGPPGQEHGREQTIKAHWSSLLTKAGKSEHGGRSRDVLHGERVASGTTWMGR